MLESSPYAVPVRPVLPVAPYQGGKRNLAGRIVARLDAHRHALYAEPFVGMGGVFLRRRQRIRCEVVNDLSADVTTLFRVLQRHYQAFMDMLRWQVTSRAEFDRLLAARAETLTDLERAARFLYLQRVAFGGKVVGRNFAMVTASGARFDITKLGSMLEEVHERLAGVVIERMPYERLLARYDGPQTLFYVDPPYWGTEDAYGPGFGPEDFGCLAEALSGLRGEFLLSINDYPEVREVFGRFALEPIRTTYTIGSGRPTAGGAGELLIAKRGSPLLASPKGA